MAKKIIVFDFDKTFTYKDTVLDFYIFLSKNNISFLLKLIIYLFLMIFCKFNMISNDYLKQNGFNLFLKGLSVEYLEKKAKKFASNIVFNKLYHSYDFKLTIDRVIIISASYELYLKYIFPKNIEIYGSTFNSINGRAETFNFNCYSTNKNTILKYNKIININTFYTDSYTDKCLAKISEEVIIVNRDKLYKCKDINDFNDFFRK